MAVYRAGIAKGRLKPVGSWKRHLISTNVAYSKFPMYPKQIIKHPLLWVFIVVSLAYSLPYIILGSDVVLRIHDTLDGRFSRLVSFAMYGQFDGVDLLNPAIMNGIVDNALGGKFNLILQMFLVLDPLVAYALNDIFLHILGGVGAFLLLRDYVFCTKSDEKGETYPSWMIVGCSCCFAFLPFFALVGGSISGLPLLLWSFLNLREQRKMLISCFVIALVPFYSFLAATGLFVLLALVVWLAVDTFRQRSLNRMFLAGIILLVVSYTIVEWNLVRQVFIQSEFVSHRSTWSYIWHYDMKEAIRIGLGKFVHVQSHEYSLHTFTLLFSFFAILNECIKKNLIERSWLDTLIVVGAVVFATILCYFNWGNLIPIKRVPEIDHVFATLPQIQNPIWKNSIEIVSLYLVFVLSLSVPLIVIGVVISCLFTNNNCQFMNPKLKYLFMLVTGTLAISMFHGFYRWRGIIPVKEVFPFFKQFQFDRFYFLSPLLWFLIFALSLSMVFKLRFGRWLCLIAIIGQIFYLYDNSSTINSYKTNVVASLQKITGSNYSAGFLTYRQFFSPELFKEIKDYIGRPQSDYRIVSVGLYPSIATYNGYYTLDGYVNNYSLEYKKQFRKVIDKELSKSTRWREYFDNWGSRCYIFVAELDKGWFENTKNNNYQITNMKLNIDQLKSMGGEYILSAFRIMNDMDNELLLMNVFERDDSLWRIYLYNVM